MVGNQEFLKHYKPENIPLAASRFRSDARLPVLKDVLDGGHCRVFKLEFPGICDTWLMRVPIHNRFLTREPLLYSLDSEQSIITSLQRLNAPWQPRLIGSSISFDNDIGYPFLLLEWVHGTALEWTEEYPSRANRDKILSQLAVIQESLIAHTRVDGINASVHLLQIVDRKFHRVESGALPDLTIRDCLHQKELMHDMILPELDAAGLALDHADLKAANIIVDDDWNIKGIIDWGFAQMAPVHLAARLPGLLQLWDPTARPSQVMLKDREVFLGALGATEAARWMRTMLSATNVDFRHQYFESIVNKGMHKTLADLNWCGWLPSDPESEQSSERPAEEQGVSQSR